MKIKLSELGQMMSRDCYLWPKAPRDDMGAAGEALCAMIEVLSQCDVVVDIKADTYSEAYRVIDSITRDKPEVLGQVLDTVRVGLGSFQPIAVSMPTRAISCSVAA